eukprot:950774-Rhodomonas_salina.1
METESVALRRTHSDPCPLNLKCPRCTSCHLREDGTSAKDGSGMGLRKGDGEIWGENSERKGANGAGSYHLQSPLRLAALISLQAWCTQLLQSTYARQ